MRIALMVIGYNPDMPRQRHYCGLNQLHFIITSTYYLDRTHRNGHDVCAIRG
jgi:hypothetical protein